jgi:uncharacterized delta-60 repeat protein
MRYKVHISMNSKKEKTKRRYGMVRETLFILIFFLPVTASFAQVDTVWVARYDGIAHSIDYGRAVAADDIGNVYVTGRTCVSGSYDEFGTIKYDVDGNEDWVRRYDGPGTGDDYGNDLVLDPSGNICVTGASTGAGSAYDYATIKYTPAGGTAWEKRYDGPGNSTDWPTSIAVDPSGNVYVTGYSYGSSGDVEYATLKYKWDDGTQLWAKRYTDPGAEDYYARDIAVDNSGNCYVTGESRTSSIIRDYVTVKYLSDGTEDWVRTYDGGYGSDYGRAIAVDDGSGNVYVTGMSNGAAGYDYATVKYLSDGTEDWVERYNADGSNSDDAKDVVVDGSGNIYVTGHSKTAATNYDYATIKYTPSKGTAWVRRYNAFDGYDGGTALAVDASDNVYVTGRIQEGTYYDYGTIKYSTDGTEEWVVRYDGTGNQSDYVQDIFVDDQKNVYITGYSRNASGNDDYATVKYSPPATGVELVNLDAISQDCKIRVRWYFSGSDAISAYILKRAEGKDNDYATIAHLSGSGSSPLPREYHYDDRDVEADVQYRYKLGVVETDGNTMWYGPVSAAASGMKPSLSISPNPFVTSTTISLRGVSAYQNTGISELQIFDVSGRKVREISLLTFHFSLGVTWDGRDDDGKRVPEGIYFCTLQLRDYSVTKKVILLR